MIKLIKKLYSYEFIRYSIGWWLAAILDLIVLWVCTDVFWFYYLFSAVIAFIISFTFWYLFQKYITFRDMSKKHIKQWWLFLAFQLIWQWIYMWVLWLWVDILGFYYMFVAIIWKWIAFIRNYLSNHYFNFKN
jgi:putative flippase GtrA